MKIKSAPQGVALILALLVSLNAHTASACQRNSDDKSAAPASDTTGSAAKADNSGSAKTPSVEDRVRALEQLIDQQQREIQSLRAIIDKRDPNNTAARPGESPMGTAQPAGLSASPPTAVATNQTPASGSLRRRLRVRVLGIPVKTPWKRESGSLS